MKKVIVLATLLGGMVFAVPAFAQGELVPFERPTFTGFTATALVGVDVVRADDGTDSESENGVAYGGAVGYDLGLGHFVFGVEAELADSSTETTETSVITAGDSFTLKADRDIYVGARAGVRAGSNVLLYVKGGYTNARIKAVYTSGATTVSASDELDGFRVGAGGEVAFGKVFGRLEYRYSDYGEFSFQGTPTGVSVTRHQVLAGIGYRF